MFKLRATLTDGFSFDLDQVFDSQWRANRAACQFITDYSDPCGLGVRCREVAVVEVSR